MKNLLIILLSALSLTAVAQEDVKRVAILETVDKLGTVPYLKQLMFRSNLTTAITNTDGYEGYDRTDLKEILGEQNFQRTGLVSDKDIKKIGEFTGAQYVLIAEATIDGNDLFITAKIIDVETARVIRNSNQLMGTSSAEMQEGSQKVAAELLGRSVRISKGTGKKNTSFSDNATLYVDLGLPSGTLWKETNEDCGLITFDQAYNFYGKSIPSKEQWEELRDKCLWTWNGNGYIVIGRNGSHITLPASGDCDCMRNVSNLGLDGRYWTSTSNGSDGGWRLYFDKSGIFISNGRRCRGQSVRLVK